MSSSRARGLLFATLCLAILFTPVLSSAQDEGPATVDRLVALAGGSIWEESAAVPILASDIELEALLLLVRRHGDGWRERSIDPALVREALRRVALTRLLSLTARRYDEEIPPEAADSLKKELTEKAGGEDAMQELLARCGADQVDFDAWARDAAYAFARILSVAERTEPPSQEEIVRRFERGAHPYTGKPLASVLRPFRRWLMRERAKKILEEEIREMLEHQPIRVVH